MIKGETGRPLRTDGRDGGQDLSAFDAPELSAEEMASHYSNIVARAFERTGKVEVVEIAASVGQIHIMARVKKEHAPMVVEDLFDRLLDNTEGVCETYLGTQYLKRNKRLRYCWVLSFCSADLRKAAQVICDTIDSVVPRAEVLEAPLLGPPPPQGGGKRKGAQPIRG